MKLNDTEAGVLQQAPIAIFMLVAGADGRRSTEEKNAYILTWRHQVDTDQFGPMSSDPRQEQVWQWLFTAEEGTYLSMASMSDNDLWSIVSRAGGILRNLDDACDFTEVQNITRSFTALARAVAMAPTLTFLGAALGRSVSEEEQAVIRKITGLFRIDRCAAA